MQAYPRKGYARSPQLHCIISSIGIYQVCNWISMIVFKSHSRYIIILLILNSFNSRQTCPTVEQIIVLTPPLVNVKISSPSSLFLFVFRLLDLREFLPKRSHDAHQAPMSAFVNCVLSFCLTKISMFSSGSLAMTSCIVRAASRT